MNKQRFRLVFNKVRSVLMAVAEITVSCVGKAAGETRGLLGKGFGAVSAAAKVVGIFGAGGFAAFRPVTALVWVALGLAVAGVSVAAPHGQLRDHFRSGTLPLSAPSAEWGLPLLPLVPFKNKNFSAELPAQKPTFYEHKLLQKSIKTKLVPQNVGQGWPQGLEPLSGQTPAQNPSQNSGLTGQSNAAGTGAEVGAAGDILSDKTASKNQRATVLEAGNGVPVINIQTPSAAGVSRNVYGVFDVTADGVILNNSRTNTPTVLGGWVQGNPWLGLGAARVILNEVNSTNPSVLNGYIEVAGQRAEVIIANPAGISCDGCGFINASRATLTTGTPLLDAGRISGYRVVDGVIQISGQGLDSHGVDFTDILARRIALDGAVSAERLTLIAGANDIELTQESGVLPAVSSSAQTAAKLVSESLPEAERWGIDSTALGGMTAGQITLVATEAGVGVRHAGTMYAGVGEVRITANGDLVNAGQINGGAVALSASDRLQNSGKVYAEGDLAIQAQFIEN